MNGSRSPEALDIFCDLDGTQVLVGTASFSYRRATVATSFAYDRTYLARPGAYPLEPRLALSTTPYPTAGIPSAFDDSTPDWWGQRLLERKARLSGSPAPLSQVDLLVGVSDLTRQGSLRYRVPGTGEFLAVCADIPKLVDLGDLLRAADSVVADDPDIGQALKLLLDAGTSALGGARPKASVQEGGELFIAKFPHPEDQWDVMAWEKTALDLAEMCGIEVPGRRLVRVADRSVLLISRFDRTASGRRVGYVSAKTLAERPSSAGNDYLDLVDAISDHSAAAAAQLVQLWQRIAFGVAVNNTDDHFNNHGFLQAAGGWLLSPAFDVNIAPVLARPRSSSLAGASTREESLRRLVSESEYFGLNADQARGRLRELAEVLAGWREVAVANDAGDLELLGAVVEDFVSSPVRI